MDNPLVSIVVPTHNRKISVTRLIDSILLSTYKNFEIIVIDDFSQDGTLDFLNKNFKRNKKIKLIRNKKNLFTAGTRNVGQSEARGELILFVDDDNVVDRKMIEAMVDVFLNDEEIGLAGPINYSFKKNKKILWAGTYRNMFTTKTHHIAKLPRLIETWETPDIPNAFMVRSRIVNIKP